VTDEAPPDRRPSRYQPSPPEADLDAALWPAPAQPAPELPAPAQPAGTVPARRPDRAAAPPRVSARERIRAERAHRATRRRLRVAAGSVGVIVILGAAAATAVIVLPARVSAVKVSTGYAGPFAPVTLNLDNSVTMAQPGVAKPVLDVYEDFRCPACTTFENAAGGMIQRLAQHGQVKVIYYPFTAVSGQPQQASSIRAWAAAKCAPARRWARYHNALYANQPTETTSGGFPASALVQLGQDVGITSHAFAQCVRSQKYAAQDPPLSDQIINSGVGNAPILKLNGRVLSVGQTASELRQRILSTR
jgi:protein-disulfide isomerase